MQGGHDVGDQSLFGGVEDDAKHDGDGQQGEAGGGEPGEARFELLEARESGVVGRGQLGGGVGRVDPDPALDGGVPDCDDQRGGGEAHEPGAERIDVADPLALQSGSGEVPGEHDEPEQGSKDVDPFEEPAEPLGGEVRRPASDRSTLR